MAALDAETRASVVQQANDMAKRLQISPEQALYNYAKSNGISTAQIDEYMGFPAGTSQNWLANSNPEPVKNNPAPNENIGFGSQQAASVNPVVATQATQTLAGPVDKATATGYNASTYSPAMQENASQATATGYNASQLGPASQATATGYNAATMGPAAQARAYGYDASRANLGLGLGSMGASDPTQANSRLLSGQVNNPYLDAQADNITKRLNRNLQENILPGIGQGATLAGQYGGSRQGIAQGKAIADTQDNLAGTLANMYSGANEAAQGRMSQAAGNLSGIGASLEGQNAGYENQARQYGASANNANSMFNASAQNNVNLANIAAQNQAGQYNSGLQAQNSQFNAGQNNQYGIANQNATNQANQYNSGLNTQNSQFNAGQNNQLSALNQNAANSANQYNAGSMNQAGQFDAGAQNQASQYNAGLSAQNNQFNAGQANNLGLSNSSAINTANQYTAGLTNQNNQFNAGQANSYDLGLRSSDLGFGQLDANINQQNFNNQLQSANFGMGVYNTLNGNNQTGINAGTNIQNTPLDYQKYFTNSANSVGQGFGTQTTQGSTPTQSNGLMGALGGAQLGSGIYNTLANMNWA